VRSTPSNFLSGFVVARPLKRFDAEWAARPMDTARNSFDYQRGLRRCGNSGAELARRRSGEKRINYCCGKV
jgi:hypothetical protein